MGKTKRRKRWGEPGFVPDGKGIVKTPPSRKDHALYNQRPLRRQETRTAWQIARGWDPDDLVWPPGGRKPNPFWRW